MAEKIISKGFYSHPGIPNFVSAKQYIVVRKGTENQLFFRFENPKNETLTAISFTVDCYDTDGNIVKTQKIEQAGLKAKAHAFFTVNRPVVLDVYYVDFKVTIHSVRYGDYCYITHENDLEVVYEKQEGEKKTDRTPFLYKLGGNTQKAVFRTIHTPSFFVTLVAMVLIVLFSVITFKLQDFAKTEEFFTLDQVEYMFASDNHEDGPIIIVDNISYAENIIVPDQIEGHDIVAVASRAFEDSNVRTITFKGNIEIENNAFADCDRLQSIHIESTRRIGSRAFFNCHNLESIVIDRELESIGELAFGNCSSLVDVSLPNSLLSIEDEAFGDCLSLSELVIPDSTTSIGMNFLSGCDSLELLQVPFVGSTLNNPQKLRYFFNTKTPRSLKELVVTKIDTVKKSMFAGESNLETIRFLSPITTIGGYAFENCSGLKTFDIPETVTSIGVNAFSNCSSLESITLPKGLARIDDNTFKGCSDLETVNLPEILTYVGSSAFEDCSSLKALKFPATMEFIGPQALQNCTGLTELVLPFLGTSPSEWTQSLSSIIAHGKFCNLESFTLLSALTVPEYAFANFSKLTSITLPENLSAISAYCFQNCRSLREIALPKNITAIGDYAFYNCASLQTIVVPQTVASTGDYAFSYCSSLQSATFQNDAMIVGLSMLDNCSSLTNLKLPANLTAIPENLCQNCSSLESIVLPSSVEVLSDYAFAGCSMLKNVVMPLQLTEIGYASFSDCSSLPAFTISNSVQTIGDYAFSGCSSLTAMSIPTSVTTLGYGVFANCNSLVNFSAPFPTDYSNGVDFRYYFNNAFSPASLTHVTITRVNSQSLPDNAFKDCEYIQELILPNDLLSIGSYAFRNCNSLQSLIIPDSVTSMGLGMLINTNALESITLPHAGVSSFYGAYSFKYFYCENTSYYSPYYIPGNLQTVTLTKAEFIPAYAFQGMSSIRHINLPNTLLQIAEYAFSDCSSLCDIGLPASLSHVDSTAFSGCTRLYMVTNLSSLSVSQTFPCVLRVFSSATEKANNTLQSNDFTLLRTTDEQWYLTDYNYNTAQMMLPNNVRFQSNVVKYALPNYLFYNNNHLTSVHIPNDVTKIGSYTFQECSNLTTVSTDSNSSLEEIGDYAFAYCYSLKTVSFADSSPLSSIGNSVFYYASALTSVNIPASVTSIGNSAFSNCSSLISVGFAPNGQLAQISDYAFTSTALTSVAIPASVTSIGNSAFSNCSSLISVGFAPNGQLDQIGDYAFTNTALASVTIPASVTSIGSYAFYDCPAITNVTFAQDGQLGSIGNNAFYATAVSELNLPSSITSMGDYAFAYCPNLTTVILRSDFNCDSNAFSGSNNILEIYNLADLSLSVGSSAYGQVACNAIIIHTDETAERLHDVDANGFLFKKSDDHWFLMGLAENNNPSALVLDSFDYNGQTVQSFVVYKNAFNSNASIQSISIGSAVSKIMACAFYGCSNVTTLTFTDGCTLTEIDDYAFSGCEKIRELVLPNSLKTIGNYSFNNCEQLEKVVLPTQLTSIDFGAFQACYMLYDVVNLSSLSITKGQTDYGHVGYYALAVRTNNTSLSETVFATDNMSAKFIKYSNAWYLVRLDVTYSADLLEIPVLTINETVYDYEIFGHALRSLQSYYNNYSILMHKNVSKLSTDSFNYLSNHTIFFYGSESDWGKLDKNDTLPYAYTFVDCLHEENAYQWTYDENGSIATKPLDLEEIMISEPTCKDTGSKKTVCHVCEWEKTETLPKTDEHALENDTCTVCGKVKTVAIINVTENNFQSCAFITNDSSYPFVISNTGVISSQNHANYSSSTLTITAANTMTVTFSYMVSSEPNYDRFRIKSNNEEKVSISGSTSYEEYTITLNAGDTLSFVYSKDSSASHGNDCAYIKDLKVETTVFTDPEA